MCHASWCPSTQKMKITTTADMFIHTTKFVSLKGFLCIAQMCLWPQTYCFARTINAQETSNVLNPTALNTELFVMESMIVQMEKMNQCVSPGIVQVRVLQTKHKPMCVELK